MINAIIIDDEERCRRVLINTLKDGQQQVNILASCASAKEGKEAIQKLTPDLIFLDVEMPGKTGFELLQEMDTIDFDVIFTTAYDKYAIQAIKASALDFLLKPVGLDDLEEALKKFERKRDKQQVTKQVEVLLQHYGKGIDAPKKIAVPTASGLEFIRIDNIVRLQAHSNYTTLFLTGNIKYVVAKTLKEMEELLSAYSFLRVHQSHLINTHFIKGYNKGDSTIVMEDGSEVELSRLKKSDFLDFFKK